MIVTFRRRKNPPQLIKSADHAKVHFSIFATRSGILCNCLSSWTTLLMVVNVTEADKPVLQEFLGWEDYVNSSLRRHYESEVIGIFLFFVFVLFVFFFCFLERSPLLRNQHVKLILLWSNELMNQSRRPWNLSYNQYTPVWQAHCTTQTATPNSGTSYIPVDGT
jgi:hypothetical protein